MGADSGCVRGVLTHPDLNAFDPSPPLLCKKKSLFFLLCQLLTESNITGKPKYELT